MKKILLLIILSVLCQPVFSQGRVTMKKIWLEHNVLENGETGMKVHISFSIHGMLGKECKAIAYFDHPKGVGVKDKNGKYCTTGGTVCTSTTFTPIYTNCKWDDFSLFIPNEELHFMSGKRTYYTRVFIQGPDGKFLGNSDFASYAATGSNEDQIFYANNSSSSTIRQSGNIAYLDKLRQYAEYDHIKADLGKITSSKHETYNNGSHLIYRYYTDKGWEKTLSINDCVLCNGTGNKNFALSSVLGMPYEKCIWCGGDGKTIRITAMCDKAIYDQDGIPHLLSEGNNCSNCYVNSSSPIISSSSSSSSSQKVDNRCSTCNGTGTCTRCHGKCGRWEDTGYYTGSNTKSWISCPSCNGNGRCSICRGSGRI